MKNVLTVDVEDWYQTSDFNFETSSWWRYEDRVVGNTTVLLDLFEYYQVRGTFFVLGCVAEQHPNLIEDIVRRGHEIGSHGGWHQMVNTVTIDQFHEDLLYSKRILEGISGKKVQLFRAPSWSITPDRFDVLGILAEEGFICDSSLQPFRTPLSGVTGTPIDPFFPVLNGRELKLLEFPPSVLKWAGITFPFCGGFYLRALPFSFLAWALRQVNRTRIGMIYVHPWEIDTQQPLLDSSPVIRFVHYYNLGTTKDKLERLLQKFQFGPLGEVIANQRFPTFSLSRAGRRIKSGEHFHGM